MARTVYLYDPPDRCVVGTVGQPGERVFYLQTRSGSRITSVVIEKEQAELLAELFWLKTAATCRSRCC